MKKIEAILTPYRWDAVREVLLQRGCQEVIVSDVSIENGLSRSFRGLPYTGATHLVKVEAIVVDAEAMPTAEAILHEGPESAARDERVMVQAVEDVISIGIWKVNPRGQAGCSPADACGRATSITPSLSANRS